jgi:LPS-assembly protein
VGPSSKATSRIPDGRHKSSLRRIAVTLLAAALASVPASAFSQTPTAGVGATGVTSAPVGPAASGGATAATGSRSERRGERDDDHRWREETAPCNPVDSPQDVPADASASEAPPEPDGPPIEEPDAPEPGAEPARSPITVEADSLEVEQETEKATARGNVIVEWNTTRLTAGELSVNQRERRVDATGGVSYESDELRATAASATLDVDDETGVLVDPAMHLAGEEGRFGGSRLEKTEGRRVLLDDGYFTTCPVDQGHEPDWELKGKSLDVRYDDYARMRNARLEVRGVPVFYLPYVLFPTKQTRQSGLLPFSLGTSTNRGFLFSLPGYWAIDKHQDLTMTAVVETSARFGIDGVYRYAPSRKRWGELHAAYYNEEIRGEPRPDTPAVGVPDNRGSVELLHREYGKGWTGYADIQWVGDERYLREISALQGDAPERDYRRSQRYTASRLGILASKGFTSGGVEAAAYQDLIGRVVDDGDDTSADPVIRDTLQKPLAGWLRTDGSLGPVAYAVDSSLGSFIREKGASGERLDIASTIALPLLTTGPVLSRAWASGRGSAYAMQERDVLDEEEQFVQRLDTFPTRGIFDAGIDVRSKFARDFEFEDTEQWKGLYHTLEPFAAIHYTNRSTYDDIPLFDRLDAIDGRDVATYGVDSRFLLRRLSAAANASRDTPSGPFELARLSISQSYNLSREVVDDHFSDIDIAAFVQPVEGFAVRTLTSWNVGSNQVSGANASVSWETGPVGPILRGPNSQIAAAYRYVRNTTDADDVLQSTEMLARLDFTRNFAVGLKALYDIVGNTFVEKAVGVTFTSSCDCWSIGLGVVERVNPSINYGLGNEGANDELQVRLAFELRGLGGFGSGVTQRSSPALDSVEYEDIGFWRAGW